MSTNGDGSNHVNSGASSPTINQWNHIAYVRKGTGGTDLSIYLDGVAVGSAASGNFDAKTAGEQLALGVYYTDQPFGIWSNGYFDNIRVTKGEALWTTGFTPPTAYAANGGNNAVLFITAEETVT